MWRSNCRECPNGQTQSEKIDLTIDIQKGAYPNEPINFEGVADEKPGITSGDLNFIITQMDHDYFHRDGDHLYVTMEIPLVDALVSLDCSAGINPWEDESDSIPFVSHRYFRVPYPSCTIMFSFTRDSQHNSLDRILPRIHSPRRTQIHHQR